MLALITGGSGSGKSAYAEKLACKLAENKREKNRCYYLATMMVFGEEGRRKVERHKNMRKGKGFLTVEQPLDIINFLEQSGGYAGGETQSRESAGERDTVLLECMSNLTANEMFRKQPPEEPETVTEKIVSEIDCLGERLKHLVIVTNNVFEDGILYEKETMAYIRALGEINRRLAERADVVTEVVAGIPVAVKGERLL